ncbi:hypothetical protein mRhiFer1_009243 [Rhinolophus ferrumequinum]|uniref:Uncharacterized protein n=1 Tax=Rhinolophus ferrumequinum TaxID=59479 RepID=A0A7J7S859_RHIFE|nr:hypothetical protein mRhiFer1_009243 [Rhinolophus ferrumequinum]
MLEARLGQRANLSSFPSVFKCILWASFLPCPWKGCGESGAASIVRCVHCNKTYKLHLEIEAAPFPAWAAASLALWWGGRQQLLGLGLGLVLSRVATLRGMGRGKFTLDQCCCELASGSPSLVCV